MSKDDEAQWHQGIYQYDYAGRKNNGEKFNGLAWPFLEGQPWSKVLKSD